jgi:hypothetical protein
MRQGPQMWWRLWAFKVTRRSSPTRIPRLRSGGSSIAYRVRTACAVLCVCRTSMRTLLAGDTHARPPPWADRCPPTRGVFMLLHLRGIGKALRLCPTGAAPGCGLSLACAGQGRSRPRTHHPSPPRPLSSLSAGSPPAADPTWRVTAQRGGTSPRRRPGATASSLGCHCPMHLRNVQGPLASAKGNI